MSVSISVKINYEGLSLSWFGQIHFCHLHSVMLITLVCNSSLLLYLVQYCQLNRYNREQSTTNSGHVICFTCSKILFQEMLFSSFFVGNFLRFCRTKVSVNVHCGLNSRNFWLSFWFEKIPCTVFMRLHGGTLFSYLFFTFFVCYRTWGYRNWHFNILFKSYFLNFLKVGNPKEDIFWTTIYGLFLNYMII